MFTLGQFAEAVGAADPASGPRTCWPRSASAGAPPTPRYDVTDPYRRGPEAARPAPPRSRSCCASSSRPHRHQEDRPWTTCITTTFFAILAAGFFVGIVVGLTGMGGGALMTPALIFLGVGEAATVVTADLTAAAVYKSGGAIVHYREGSPNLALAKWLIIGSVPDGAAGAVPRLPAVTDSPTSSTTC